MRRLINRKLALQKVIDYVWKKNETDTHKYLYMHIVSQLYVVCKGNAYQFKLYFEEQVAETSAIK